MEEKILASVQYFYTHVEKRSLPLEASKALVSLYQGKPQKGIALSMLEKTKKLLSLWLEDSSQIQIYKRYFNFLSKKESYTLGECFSPFVLVSCWESFHELIVKERDRRKEAFSWLRDFFQGIGVESTLDIQKPEELFEELLNRLGSLGEHSFYVATHFAYMLNPHIFIPVTPASGRSLSIKEPDAYFRLIDSTRYRRIKPIEAHAFMHLLFEDVPSKVRGAESILGIDREFELLKMAQKLWEEEKFYEAHEVLEEVWEYVKDEKKRECYQGVIRLAISLHHYTEGKREKAIRVLSKAVRQIEGCPSEVRLNLRELGSSASELLRTLREGKRVGSLPKLRVV